MSFKLKSSMEKEMAAHSNILAWKIPWTEEPGRLLFMVSQKVSCLSNFAKTRGENPEVDLWSQLWSASFNMTCTFSKIKRTRGIILLWQ